METNVLQWSQQVDRAVNKYAGRRSAGDKDDLRQECYLGLLEAAETLERLRAKDPNEAKAFAAAVAKKKILYFLRTERHLTTVQSAARAWEIHCPACGVLIRSDNTEPEGCPDCSDPQAIVLPWEKPE